MGQVVRTSTALSLSEASFVRAAILHSTSSIDLSQAAKRYLGHRLEALHGSSPAKLARELFAAFLAAVPAAVASLGRAHDADRRQSATQLERALKNLHGVDPVSVKPAPASAAKPLAAPPPTLDAWIKSYEAEHPHVDLGEFSEGELLEMYRDEVGIDVPVVADEDPLPSPAAAPAGLDPVTVARDFMFLAGLVAEDPHPADPCSRWLAPSVAQALRGASEPVSTLADLRAFIRKHGFRWWTKVDGLGAARAVKVYEWAVALAMQDEVASPSPALPFPTGSKGAAAAFEALGLTDESFGLLLDPATRSRLPKRRGIAPVEFLELRPDLEADSWAARRWLIGFLPNSATLRAYHLAMERLVIWLQVRGHPSLSTLMPEHLSAFEEFLRDPGPQWCTCLRPHRFESTWRPFKAKRHGGGGLAPASLALNMAAVKSFYRWAQQQGWAANPFQDRPIQMAE